MSEDLGEPRPLTKDVVDAIFEGSHQIAPTEILTRPGWDEYFMGIAFAVAKRGSCRRKQVGAILVDEDRRIVGGGYNGAPRGMPDCLEVGCDVRVIDGRESCVRTLHAESNALDFAIRGANNVTLFSTVIPCRPCSLRIIQAQIVRVVFFEDYQSQGTPDGVRLLAEAKIPLVQIAMPT